jgi:dynein heavy chain
LAEALPALERAKEAVNCLKKNHIGEMKALGSPPVLVILTAKVVMTLLGEKISINEADEKVWKKAGSLM